MKQLISYLRIAVPALCLLSLAAQPVDAKMADDKYNRYITFQNDFPFQVYPVIQVPRDICEGSKEGGDRRIIVNYDAATKGLPPGKKITVWIPREQKQVTIDKKPVLKNCWYQSGRVYIFPVELKAWEDNVVKFDPRTNVISKPGDDVHPQVAVDCFQGGSDSDGAKGDCKTWVSGASFPVDAPAQLAEYTFDSDNPVNQNMDTGDPMADIDVSMVDELYLPVAGSVANHGATGYMGGAAATVNQNGLNDLAVFKKRIEDFITEPVVPDGTKRVWPVFAAYLVANFNRSTKKDINTFSDLLPIESKEFGRNSGSTIPHVPGGYNSIDMTLTRANSLMYYTGENYVMDKGYFITGVSYDKEKQKPSNPQVQPYIDRWMFWVKNKDNPAFCADKSRLEKLKWPDHVCKFDSKKPVQECAFRHQDFCEKFQESVKVVWNHFTTDPVDGFDPNQDTVWGKCGFHDKPYPTDENTKNACIIHQIVGYDSKVLGGDLPGRVQALLRSVAFEANDPFDPNNPSVPKADVQQWQFDPFLTFAAPYDSQFNLNPYTRLVHGSGKDGLGSVSYSFSIDDKYGNFRDAASGFTVDAGGVTALENKRPYDPYQQYTVTWGYNRDQFSMAWLDTGTDLNSVQAKLQQIADQHGKRPFLLRQGDKLAVLGHDGSGGWHLTNPLTTKSDLEALAAQEKENSKGKNHTFQDLIDRVFLNKPADVFPALALNVNAVNEQAIGVLNFDADTGWPAGEARLYDQIVLKKADVPQANNWVSLTTCGHAVPIGGPGAQTLPLKYDAVNGYLPCEILAKDKFGDTLKLSMAPEKKTGIIDNYTGSKVTDWNTLWAFPTGKKATGAPPTTSDLSAKDLQYCIDNSSPYFGVSGFCNNLNVSAVWAGSALARDVVYMGLDYVNMPRVNVSIAQPPKDGPDPDAVFWPNGAKVTGELMPDGETVHVTWPKAIITSGKPLNYSLTFGGQFQASCNTQHNPDVNPNTYCDVKITRGDKTPKKMEVVAINYTKTPSPPQSVQLVGTFTPGSHP